MHLERVTKGLLVFLLNGYVNLHQGVGIVGVEFWRIILEFWAGGALVTSFGDPAIDILERLLYLRKLELQHGILIRWNVPAHHALGDVHYFRDLGRTDVIKLAGFLVIVVHDPITFIRWGEILDLPYARFKLAPERRDLSSPSGFPLYFMPTIVKVGFDTISGSMINSFGRYAPF